MALWRETSNEARHRTFAWTMCICRPSEGPLTAPTPPIFLAQCSAWGHAICSFPPNELRMERSKHQLGPQSFTLLLASSFPSSSVHGCCERKSAVVDAGRFTNPRHGLGLPTHTVPAWGVAKCRMIKAGRWRCDAVPNNVQWSFCQLPETLAQETVTTHEYDRTR